MKQFKMIFGITGALLLTVCGDALAQRDAAMDVRQSFPEQRQAIIQDLNGEKYVEISVQDKDTVLRALDRIALQVEGDRQTLANLPESARVEIFNDQNLINNILANAGEESRLICRREKSVNSRLAQNNCMTVAERRRQRTTAQDDITRARRTMKTTN